MVWIDLVRFLTPDETAESTDIYLIKRGNLTKYLLKDSNIEIHELNGETSLKDKEMLPFFDGIYRSGYRPIMPSEDGIKFKGKIWVIVDTYSASAADEFAIFCRNTNFATVVGSSRTGGSGIGLAPVSFVLPNSGLVIRLDLAHGINSDGTLNTLMGTEPDIYVPSGRSPVNYILQELIE